MRKSLFLLILLLFQLSWLNLCSQEECVFTLQRAQRQYQAGQLDTIPGMLKPCIESGFTRAERETAYKLVIQSYLYNDEPDLAEQMMIEFLKKYPEYELTPADPAEFVYLYKSYKTVPAFSIGALVGGVLTFPYSVEPFGVYSLNNTSAHYTSSSPGFHVGLSISRYLVQGVDLNLGLMYHNYKYKLEVTSFDFAKTSYTENMTAFAFPLSLTYDFGHHKIKPYLRAGIMTTYYLNSSKDSHRDYTDNSNEPVTGEAIQTKDYNSRTKVNVYGIAGAGLKYKISNAGFFLLDMRYVPGFTHIINMENNLGPHSEDIWRYYVTDSDILFNHFTFSVGWIYPVYASKKQPKSIQMSLTK